jgi:hypothetical protein
MLSSKLSGLKLSDGHFPCISSCCYRNQDFCSLQHLAFQYPAKCSSPNSPHNLTLVFTFHSIQSCLALVISYGGEVILSLFCIRSDLYFEIFNNCIKTESRGMRSQKSSVLAKTYILGLTPRTRGESCLFVPLRAILGADCPISQSVSYKLRIYFS